ncbi:MAG: potassium channel family protein [Bacillota bacterium]
MKQFAVIGLGRFGTSVAGTLNMMGYEVLVMDKDEGRVNDLADIVTHAVQVDAIEENSLKSLGIRNFDVVVVAIGHEIQSSILITLMLKEMGVKKVVVKAATELHGKVLRKIGADVVVFPERDMGERVARMLVSENVIDQINLSPDYSLVELIAPADLTKKTLEESDLRNKYGVTVLAIRRGQEFIISPGAKESVFDGDILIVIGKNEKLKKFEKR